MNARAILVVELVRKGSMNPFKWGKSILENRNIKECADAIYAGVIYNVGLLCDVRFARLTGHKEHERRI